MTPAINTNTYGSLTQHLASNDSIVVVDDTVEFTLADVYAFAMNLFDETIIKQDEWQDDYNDCVSGDLDVCTWNAEDGTDVRGYRPFVLDPIDTTNQVVEVVKYPSYWDAQNVWANRIVYKKIETKEAAISELADGSIDIFDSQYVPGVSEFEGEDGITEVFVGDPASQEISLNFLNPYYGTGENIPDVNGKITNDADLSRSFAKQ